MERLTFKGDFCAIARCDEKRGGAYCPDGYCSQRSVWERLAAYEATGLSPEEVAELAQAKKDGRLVVLPCKDSTVYTVEKDIGHCTKCANKDMAYWHSAIIGFYCDDACCPLHVVAHDVEGFVISVENGIAALSPPGEWGYEGFEQFEGVDGNWYLTCEEAEAALEAAEGVET